MRYLAVIILAALSCAWPGAATADAKPKRSYQERTRDKVIKFARHQIGKPYVYGGTGPHGYDCSGLIYAAYRHAGHSIPRTTGTQLGLRHSNRKRGDLLFANAGHVALAIGKGRVIEAAHTGTSIRFASSGRFRYASRKAFRR